MHCAGKEWFYLGHVNCFLLLLDYFGDLFGSAHGTAQLSPKQSQTAYKILSSPQQRSILVPSETVSGRAETLRGSAWPWLDQA